jgi:hypothetical protein
MTGRQALRTCQTENLERLPQINYIDVGRHPRNFHIESNAFNLLESNDSLAHPRAVDKWFQASPKL